VTEDQGSEAMHKPRPKGITLLAILMFSVAIGGAAITVLFGFFFDIGVSVYFPTVIGFGYTATALASGLGLWRSANWSLVVFLCWGGFAVTLTALMGIAGVAPTSQILLASSAAAVAVLGLAFYIHSQPRTSR
jgi:hypothetical protein